MAIKIVCINKAHGNHENPHVAISNLGWVEDGTSKSGKMTRIEMYNWIKVSSGVAYVADRFGNRAQVQTAVSALGNPYVRTVSDGKWSDNLLTLGECSV